MPCCQISDSHNISSFIISDFSSIDSRSHVSQTFLVSYSSLMSPCTQSSIHFKSYSFASSASSHYSHSSIIAFSIWLRWVLSMESLSYETSRFHLKRSWISWILYSNFFSFSCFSFSIEDCMLLIHSPNRLIQSTLLPTSARA